MPSDKEGMIALLNKERPGVLKLAIATALGLTSSDLGTASNASDQPKGKVATLPTFHESNVKQWFDHVEHIPNV
jgi:hypothetical protein